MALTSLKFVITTLYGLLSMFAYALVDYVIVKNGTVFQGSFFQLFLYQSFFNCLTYFNSMVTLRLPQNTCLNCTLSPVFEGNVVPGLQIFHTIHYHMAFLQYFFTVVISGNRFSMMLFPFGYEKFWKMAILPTMVAIVLLPFIATWPFPFNRSYYEYVPLSDWYAIRTTADLGVLYSFLLGHMMITTSLGTFFNVGTLVLLVCKSRQNRAKKSELILIVHSFVVFVIETFTAVITVLNKLAVGLSQSWYMEIGQMMLPFASDGLTLVQPFLLILCSSALRNCILRLLNGQKMSQVSGQNISLVNTATISRHR